MTRPLATLSLLVLALALAAAPVVAQEIRTSQGLRTLPRTAGYSSEAQYRQAARTAEGIVFELLQDVAASESARSATTEDVTALSERVKRENADYERAKATFDQADQKYRTDLNSFQQRQAAMEAEVQQQRNQAAVLQALPSAQRDFAEVTRLNNWATQLANQRTALESERQGLLAEHDRVEAERAKLAKQRSDAEAKLRGQRDQTVQVTSAAGKKRAEAYRQLRVATNYLRRVREESVKVTKASLGKSAALEQAEAKLLRYEGGLPTN